MQAIITRSNSANVSVDQAVRDLHIDPIALIWERAILVLLLIFLSGWLRQPACDPQGQGSPGQLDATYLDPQALADTVAARLTQVNQEALTLTLDRLEQTQQVALQQALDHLDQAHKCRSEALPDHAEHVQVTLVESASEGVTMSTQVRPEQATLTVGQGQCSSLTLTSGDQPCQRVKGNALSESVDPVRQRAEGQGGDGARRDVPVFIAEHLASQGAIPGVKQVMETTGCSRDTARKYLRQVGAQSEQRSEEQAES